MAYVVPAQKKAGQTLTHTEYNVVINSVLALNARPMAEVYNASAQTFATSGSSAAVTLGSVAFNTGITFAFSTFTIVTAGYYHLDASVQWDPNSTGPRFLRALINGVQTVPLVSGVQACSGVPTTNMLQSNLRLHVGDTVSLNAIQYSGGSLDIASGKAHLGLFLTHYGI